MNLLEAQDNEATAKSLLQSHKNDIEIPKSNLAFILSAAYLILRLKMAFSDYCQDTEHLNYDLERDFNRLFLGTKIEI